MIGSWAIGPVTFTRIYTPRRATYEHAENKSVESLNYPDSARNHGQRKNDTNSKPQYMTSQTVGLMRAWYYRHPPADNQLIYESAKIKEEGEYGDHQLPYWELTPGTLWVKALTTCTSFIAGPAKDFRVRGP